MQVTVGFPHALIITLTTGITGAYRPPLLAADAYTVSVITATRPTTLSPAYDPGGSHDSSTVKNLSAGEERPERTSGMP